MRVQSVIFETARVKLVILLKLNGINCHIMEIEGYKLSFIKVQGYKPSILETSRVQSVTFYIYYLVDIF